MITTTMRRLVPEEFISPLKVLGKHDWLWWTPEDTTPPSTHIMTSQGLMRVSRAQRHTATDDPASRRSIVRLLDAAHD